MTEHHLTVARTARYYQLGTLSASTRRVWLVAHGYGQLAAYFIRHFAILTEADPEGTVVVAPEGLSRFYLNGTSGRVGASWMTRDDRLSEIADHCAYLEQLTDTLLAQAGPEVELQVLGFSQGTATVSRWLAHSRRRPKHLTLWAGSFPEDIEAAATAALLTELPVALVCGTKDGYVNEARFHEQAALLRRHGATVQELQFAGQHELNAEILRELAR
jgi:predicted esterase